MAIGNAIGQRLVQGIRADLTSKGANLYLKSADANGTLQFATSTEFGEDIQDIVGAFIGGTARIVPTYNDAGNSLSLDIATNSITGSQLAQIPGLTVRGNATNLTANQSDISFGTNFGVLSRNGDTLTTALITNSNIANNAVQFAKIQQLPANTLVGNLTGATANAASITTAQLKAALIDAPIIVTGATQAITTGVTYIANNASAEVVFSLPAAPAVGDTFRIIGYGAGGWRVAQAAAQQQYLNGITTQLGATSGVLGQIRFLDSWSGASWVCVAITPNAIWVCHDVFGNIRIDE